MPTDTKAAVEQTRITLHKDDIVEVSPDASYVWKAYYECAKDLRGEVIDVNERGNVAVYFKIINYTLVTEGKVFRLVVCPHH